MKNFCKLFFTISILSFNVIEQAQTNSIVRDAKISDMIKEISAINLERNVRKMVSFGTRHTLSTRSDKEKGIGAACNWVKSEFEKFARESGGRLDVKLDSLIIEPDGRRIVRKTLLTNVVATLKGIDINDKRIFIVSGHLDSRNSEANDSTELAPGANDDASGVSAVLELARVMSKQSFP